MENHLLPLLIHTKNDSITEIDIRILVNLTLPVECLYPMDIMQRTEAGRHAISDCEHLLSDCKNLFASHRALKAIVDQLKKILEKDSKLSTFQCENVNNCLLLIRNILHIPEKIFVPYPGKNYREIQNEIIWNLFALNIDKLLIYLMSCAQRSAFGISIVQVIALLYKDQHVNNLQKLLNTWYEPSPLSDSSGDFESNTTATKRDNEDSSPMLTSDSSDNGGIVSKVNNITGERRLSGPTKSTEHQQNVSMDTQRCPSKTGTASCVIINII